MLNETDQRINMDIIRTVLRKPHTAHLVEFCFECVSSFITDDSVAIIVDFETLSHISQDFDFCIDYQPSAHVDEALRFIVGRFMNKIVFSSVLVPENTLTVIDVFEGNKTTINKLMFAF